MTRVADLAVDYLGAARRGDREAVESHRDALSDIDRDALADTLDTDPARLAFWLTVYNAAAQDRLRADPSRFDSRWRFFRADAVTVAGRALSLDDIEHGLLRRSHSKYGLGYLPRVPRGSFERRFRLDERDARVHFGLNCGARSCPPVAAYDPDSVEERLDAVAAHYLDAEVEVSPDRSRVRVPRLFLWFHGDFGGAAGTREWLRRYDVIAADAEPRVRYRSHDWSLALDRFYEE